MYIFEEIRRNCKHQDLYRNKDDFWFFHIQKKFYCLMWKILYLISISVKYIFWQI